jgi:protein FrlC
MRQFHWSQFSVVTAPYLHCTLSFALDSIAANGFTGVELWGASPHYCWDDFAPKERAAEARRITKMLRERGLRMTVFHPEQVRQYPINIAASDEYLRNKSINVMLDYLDDCAAFEVDRMILAPGWPFVDRYSEEDRKRAAESVHILGERAGELSVTLLMEEMDATSTLFTTNLLELKDLIQKADSNSVRCCLDLQRATNNGETPEDYIHAFGKLGHVHFSDFGKDGFMALGEGTASLERQMRSLAELEYMGTLSLYSPGAVHYPDPDRPVRVSALWLNHSNLIQK